MFTYEVPLISFLAPKEKLAEPEGPSDAVAIGAGVGGTIAVLAVIAVVANSVSCHPTLIQSASAHIVHSIMSPKLKQSASTLTAQSL